jgi:hypothetical protein
MRDYNTIKNYIKRIRSDYFLQISKQIRHKLDIDQIKSEFDLRLAKKREEHRQLTKKIRLVLNLTSEQRKNITFSAKNFDKAKFFN